MAREILLLLGVMGVMGLLCAGLTVYAMALVLLRPPRMTDGKAIYLLGRLAPSDLGLGFENVSFAVVDENSGCKLKIAGWWMENAEAAGKCALIVHGYADAKVGGIAWAPLLYSLGFSVLAVDLRAHGESGGESVSAGYWERHDLNQVIDQLKASHPVQSRQVVLFGISLGAAVCAAAAVMRGDLSAVILECPYADFRSSASSHANRVGAPGPMFQKLAFALAERMARSDFSAVSPLATIPEISCPLMLIQTTNDPVVESADRKRIQQAVELRRKSGKPSAYWELQGVHHVFGLHDQAEEYRLRVEEFLTGALQYTARLCES
jgi:uncharacterized protein